MFTYYEELAEFDRTVDRYLNNTVNKNVRDVVLESDSNTESKPDEKISKKISRAVSTVFKKLSELLTKGKVKAKAKSQVDIIRELGVEINQVSDFKIKIQDVWSFCKFANSTINKYLKYPNEKTVEIMLKERKDKKAIKLLTENLNKLASEMRHPKSKEFVIKSGKKITAEKVRGVIVANAIVYGTQKYINRESSKPIKHTNYDIENEIENMGPEIVRRDSTVTESTITMNMITVNLLLLTEFFKDAPKKLDNEDVTIGELYRRLLELKPDASISSLNDVSKNMNIFINKKTSDIDKSECFKDGNQAVQFSKEISALLTAYANFYESLVDFYIAIISSAIKSANRIYKPKKAYYKK